eukprot:jgi/Mesen1/8750/ME000052S08176
MAIVAKNGNGGGRAGEEEEEEEVVIAIGANIGDRIANIDRGLQLLREASIRVERHGCLYESAPAYVTDQPKFLNSAVQARTAMGPHNLLKALKRIEEQLGRDFAGQRFGPRPLDLDIIFYGRQRIHTPDLQVPHPRLHERPFVLAPVVDLLGRSGDLTGHWSEHEDTGGGVSRLWELQGGEDLVGSSGLERVIPLAGKMWRWGSRTHVMGILNVTPDSFSDGGKYASCADAVEQARSMVREGADLIDVGGQSTRSSQLDPRLLTACSAGRPGAHRLTCEEEMARAIPVIEAIASDPECRETVISVDTFDAKVAEAAVEAGASIVNDVSGGTLDENMSSTVARLGVPYIMMHMRGEPRTMQRDGHTAYRDVCRETAHELAERVHMAECAGVPVWRIISDPGIGFAKKKDHNLLLLRDMSRFREGLSERSVALGFMPILAGPSRKGFLGKIIGRDNVQDRDFATCAAATAAVMGGTNVIRAHNVRAVKDAVCVADAIWRSKS